MHRKSSGRRNTAFAFALTLRTLFAGVPSWITKNARTIIGNLRSYVSSVSDTSAPLDEEEMVEALLHVAERNSGLRSRGQLLVPSAYEVRIPLNTFQRLKQAGFVEQVGSDLQDTMLARMEERGWQPAGDVVLTLLPDSNLAEGEFTVVPTPVRDYEPTGFVTDAWFTASGGKRVPLPTLPIVLGRANITDPPDIVVAEADTSVSRRHIEVACDRRTGYTIRDLESTNGTTVNGVKLTSSEPAPLLHGDRIVLGGGVELIFFAAESSLRPVETVAEADPAFDPVPQYTVTSPTSGYDPWLDLI